MLFSVINFTCFYFVFVKHVQCKLSFGDVDTATVVVVAATTAWRINDGGNNVWLCDFLHRKMSINVLNFGFSPIVLVNLEMTGKHPMKTKEISKNQNKQRNMNGNIQ